MAMPTFRIVATRTTAHSSKSEADERLALDGEWCYELASGGRTRRLNAYDAHIKAVAERGYKLGVKIKNFQTVEKFSFRGTKGEIVLVTDEAVSRELSDAFGSDPDDKWVGLVPPPGTQRRATHPKPQLVCYRYSLVITPVRREPQVVPVLATYRDIRFAQHHLLHVQILTARPPTITTSVSAVFTSPVRRN